MKLFAYILLVGNLQAIRLKTQLKQSTKDADLHVGIAELMEAMKDNDDDDWVGKGVEFKPFS